MEMVGGFVGKSRNFCGLVGLMFLTSFSTCFAVLYGNNKCFWCSETGPRTSDPYALKKEAFDLVRGWPQELLDVMQKTPEDFVHKTPLADRWLWPGFSPRSWANGVVVIGDAWHPMTPNLGQGACCALEDAVVLVSKLRGVIGGRSKLIDQALREYAQERWARVFPLTIRANVVGSLLQWENPVVCSLRNNIMIPKLVRLGPFLEHTNFECESLEPAGSA